MTGYHLSKEERRVICKALSMLNASNEKVLPTLVGSMYPAIVMDEQESITKLIVRLKK